jgi:hypothetical protein
MDKQNFNKVIMMKALLSFMQKNQPKWQEIAPIANAVTRLQNLVDEIDATLLLTDNPNGGELKQKEILQTKLIEDGFELVSYIYAYADATENAVLKGKVDFPISDLRNLRDGELSQKIEFVLEQRKGHEEQLEPYGATPDKVNNLLNLISQYEEQLPKTRNNVADSKTGNKLLKQLVKTANLLLTEQLDKLMVRFKKEDPTFYTAYETNRKVVDYGKRYEKPAETEEKPVVTAP